MTKKTKTKADELAYKLEQKKAIEQDAREVRIEAEEALLFEIKKATTKTDWYKITVTENKSVKIDLEILKSLELDQKTVDGVLPEKTTRTVNKKNLAWLRDHRPNEYALLSKAITTTPNKTSVKVEKLKVKK